ncbi:helix-turn-helix domain-containing protein [bacterium]|nr:helix-turn-helix domain-containing protein [bacterium]
MKKNKFQELFLLELEKVPIVQVACEKTNLSRNTVYRWRKEDLGFAKKMDESLSKGVALVNDMSETQLLTLIKEKNWPAISFWLKHRNDNYKNKLEITTKEDDERLTPSQAKVVKQALRLAAITKSKSINNFNKDKKHE